MWTPTGVPGEGLLSFEWGFHGTNAVQATPGLHWNQELKNLKHKISHDLTKNNLDNVIEFQSFLHQSWMCIPDQIQD